MKATISINSKKPMVLIPLEDYEGILETIDILSENPNILNELKIEKNEYNKGNFTVFSKNNIKERKSNSKVIKKVKK